MISLENTLTTSSTSSLSTTSYSSDEALDAYSSLENRTLMSVLVEIFLFLNPIL